MKKFWIICTSVLLIAIAFATSVFAVNFFKNNDIVKYATKFEFKYNVLTLQLNRTYTLSKNEFVIEPSDCTESIVFATQNPEILEVNSSTSQVTTKMVGEAILFAYIKCDKTNNLSTQILVKVVEDNIQKETFELDKTFNLSNQFEMIKLDIDENILNNNIDIMQGSEILEIASIDQDRLSLVLKSTGFAKIKITTTTKIYICNITIV